MHLDLPIAQRRAIRSNAGKLPDWYGFEHDIANFVSYSNISPAYKAFIASLQSVSVPNDWRTTKQDPRWKGAMMEELSALQKNKTWDLVLLPPGKKEGKVDRYKAIINYWYLCLFWSDQLNQL